MRVAAFLQDFRREAPPLIRLALPLVAAQVSFVSMGAVDTILAGRLGAPALAAVAVGSNLWFMFFVLFQGLFMACSPIVAQRSGAADDPVRTGGFVRSAALLAIACGIAWTIAARLLANPLLSLLDLEQPTLRFTQDYMLAVSWSAGPLCLCFLLRNAAEGLGLTRVPLVAGVTGLAVNTLVAWVLMFGKGGFPALGPEGAGWAMLAGALAMVAAYLVEYLRLPGLSALRVFRRGWPERDAGVRELVRIGAPIALIMAAEAWLFQVGTLMMAPFGSLTVAAHQVAINFASIMFMVPLSVGMATTIRVGHAAGAGRSAELRLRGQVGMTIGSMFALFSAALMALFPRHIAAIYTDVPEVIPLAAHFLLFAALFQLFDCVQATANGALRGIKDTRLPMLITLAAYWLAGAPLAAWLSYSTAVGPTGVWWGFIAGLGVAAVGLAWRFMAKTRKVTSTPSAARLGT